MERRFKESIICQGYLRKSPPPDKFFFKVSSSWKKRYCVLYQNEPDSYSFKYYKDEREFKEGKHIGEFQIGILQELTDKPEVHKQWPVVQNVVMHRTESIIYLKTESRELFLFAEDRDDTKMWYLELKKIKFRKSEDECRNIGLNSLRRGNTEKDNNPQQKKCLQKTVSCPPCLNGGFHPCHCQPMAPSIQNLPKDLMTLNVPAIIISCPDHFYGHTLTTTVAQQETCFEQSACYMPDIDASLHPVNARHDKLQMGMSSENICGKWRILQHEKNMGAVSKDITLQDIEKIAFVNFQEHICVAGWKVEACSPLSEFCHVGDQVIAVGDMKPHDRNDILFFAKRYTKNKIPITFARLPEGKLFFANKTESENWGIETEGPVIKHIKPRSVAAQNGLHLPMYITDQKTVPWRITEINLHSVSLVSADKHSTQRVSCLLNKCTTELFLVLQPKDYIQGLVSAFEKMYSQWEYDTDMH